MKTQLTLRLGFITVVGWFIISACESTGAVHRAAPNYSEAVHRGVASSDTEAMFYFTEDKFKTDENRVVIYNAKVAIRVKNADSLNRKLAELSSKYDGYVVSLGNRYSSIRVKSENLNSAITEIAGLGKMSSKTISGNDVTEEYKDYEIRLDNAAKARGRYLQLLEKAENVEAALKVEKELERLNGEIDLLKGKLERLKHLSDFSTIDIQIMEKQKMGVLGYVGLGLYKAVKWLFIRN
jgi:DNA-binding MarR family transcriptional regulator